MYREIKEEVYPGCGACEICGEIDLCATCNGSFIRQLSSAEEVPLDAAKKHDKTLESWKNKIQKVFLG